jgi:hypothetical protein
VTVQFVEEFAQFQGESRQNGSAFECLRGVEKGDCPIGRVDHLTSSSSVGGSLLALPVLLAIAVAVVMGFDPPRLAVGKNR